MLQTLGQTDYNRDGENGRRSPAQGRIKEGCSSDQTTRETENMFGYVRAIFVSATAPEQASFDFVLKQDAHMCIQTQ